MKNKDIEKLLNNVDIQPSPSLKEKVLDKVDREPERVVFVKSSKKTRSIRKIAVALSICFVLIFGGVAGYVGLYNEEYTRVYVDINPSVELTLNRFNVVNNVKYLNADAAQVFDESDVLGKKTDEALSQIMKKLDEKNYFEKNSELYVSVFSEKYDAQKSVDKCYQACQNYIQEKKLNVTVNKEKLSKEDVDKAVENKLSPIKNKIIDELISAGEDFGEEIFKDDFKDFSLEEIKEKIKEFSDKKNEGEKPKDKDLDKKDR